MKDGAMRLASGDDGILAANEFSHRCVACYTPDLYLGPRVYYEARTSPPIFTPCYWPGPGLLGRMRLS